MDSAARIENFSDDFDPFTALLSIGGEGEITSPLQELARLRERQPVFEGDLHEHFGLPPQTTLAEIPRSYMVLGFEACQQVLDDPATFSSAIYQANIGITFGKSITAMDPPEHGRYRRLFQAAFSPKTISSLRPRFIELVDDLVSSFAGDGRADLVARLALQFPFSFVFALLNLPIADRAVFHRLAAAQTCVVFDPPHGIEAAEKLGRYLSSVIDERRAWKRDDDFISVLANTELDGERLPDDIVLGFLRQLMNAGGDTSYYGFSNILAALFTHSDQFEAIRNDRSLIPRAIEEGLRWGAPLTTVDRITTRDVILAGIPMERGSAVRVCIAVANRDPAIWSEPHAFNIFRKQSKHFAFGFGAHACIGQYLARMELQLALAVLLDRLPNVRLDRDMPAPVIRGLTFRGADAVHVRWDL